MRMYKGAVFLYGNIRTLHEAYRAVCEVKPFNSLVQTIVLTNENIFTDLTDCESQQ